MAYATEHWLVYLQKNDSELLKLSRMDVFKATGHGGQKKNKTSNAIRLTLAHLSVTETQSRSKAENIAGALKKLRLAIATDDQNAPQARSLIISPPEEILPYLNKGVLRINPKNDLYPLFIGYIFESFVRHGGERSAVSQDLGKTPTQFRRYLEKNVFLKRVLSELRQKLDKKED